LYLPSLRNFTMRRAVSLSIDWVIATS
jgi:hypothetical protein